MNRRVDELEIELLRPNEAAFGGAGAGGFIDVDDDLPADAFEEEPRPRWTMALAGLLVTGLLAGGVVAAAPWAGDETATPPPTTTPQSTTTTTPPPRTTVPRDPLAGVETEPSGWVATPADGTWQFGGAYSQGNVILGNTGQQLDVFAARGATRTDPWLLVYQMPYASGQLTEGAARVQFGDRPATVHVNPDGTTRVTASDPDSSANLIIDSNGLGLDQLSALAADVQIDSLTGEVHYGDLRSRDGVFGLPLRSSLSPDYPGVGLLGMANASTSYYSDGATSWLELSVRDLDTEMLDDLPLFFQPVELGPQTSTFVAELGSMGRQVQVYDVPDQPGTTIVVWPEGDQLVTVMGYRASLAELLAVAVNAHPATDDEWIDLLTESQRGITIDGQENEPSAFVRGELEDGSVWQSNLAAGWFWANSDTASWYGAVDELDVPAVHRMVGGDMTAWVAIDPTGVATTMRITVPSAEPVMVEMEPLGTGTAALHLRSVDTTAQIDLLDAAGAVVVSAAL